MKSQANTNNSLIKNVELNDSGEQKKEDTKERDNRNDKKGMEEQQLEKINVASRELLQEEGMIANTLYKTPKHLTKLASLETIPEIKDLLMELRQLENEIKRNCKELESRRISLSRVLLVKERCKIKINQLKEEIKIEEKIEIADREKDLNRKGHLQEKLKNDRRLRQAMEFSYIQSILKKEHLGTEISKYSIYQSTGMAKNIASQVNESGNFIDFNIP